MTALNARNSASDADLDRALHAALGIADADVPRLPRSVVAELAADTVETIAWTFDDMPASVSVHVERSDVLVRPADTAARPVRGPAVRMAAGLAGGVHGRVRNPFVARGRRRVVLAGALGLVVAAAGGVTVALSAHVGSAGSNGVSALAPPADWQAIPQSVPDAAARTATRRCVIELDTPRGTSVPGNSFKSDDAKLSEQRGRTVFTVLANPGAFGICLTLDGRGDGGVLRWSPDSHPSLDGVNVAENVNMWTSGTSGNHVDTTVIAGFAGSRVTRITIKRADGVVVTASMHDGVWGAWWPGPSKAMGITVYDRYGHTETRPAQ